MRTRGRGVDKSRRNGNSSGADRLPNRVALLLAGGDGMRLQDLTSEIAGTPIPKQYCRMLHGSSLLEAAISRTHLLFPMERINVVINENHLDLARDQVKALPASNIFVQPLNRDTGPGMVFALLTLECAYGDAMVAVFPTDHYIDRNWAFIAHVMRAMNAISCVPDKIARSRDRPGQAGDRLRVYPARQGPENVGQGCIRWTLLRKNRNLEDAGTIIARGGLWNTLVMVFRLSRMLDLVQEMVPREVDALFELRNSPDKATELYRTMRPWNFSTQLLARIPQHLIVFKVANVFWSDWGTRESIERTYQVVESCALLETGKSDRKCDSQ